MRFNYDYLRALQAVVRTGSFDAAAAALNISQSAISQRIKALEDQVGARLVVRGAPCSATDLGQRLTRHMEDVALMEAQLLPRQDDRPTISLAVNADSLATWLMPALGAVSDMRFDIIVDDQDHSSTLLAKGEVIAAITARAQPVQGCDVISLGAMPYVATASPDFVQHWFSDGVTADALSQAPALIYDRKDQLQSDWARREVGHPVVLTGHTLPSTTAFVEAAALGLGWGMNPRDLAASALAQGRLIGIGHDPTYDTSLYWQISRRMKPALKSLTRAVVHYAQVNLVQS